MCHNRGAQPDVDDHKGVIRLSEVTLAAISRSVYSADVSAIIAAQNRSRLVVFSFAPATMVGMSFSPGLLWDLASSSFLTFVRAAPRLT